MEETLTVKKGDTRNAISGKLKRKADGLWNAIDLTDCAVLISIENKIYKQYCQVVNGKAVYPLNESLTDMPGIFNYEFIIRYQDGREETVPNEGYFKLYVYDEVK